MLFYFFKAQYLFLFSNRRLSDSSKNVLSVYKIFLCVLLFSNCCFFSFAWNFSFCLYARIFLCFSSFCFLYLSRSFFLFFYDFLLFFILLDVFLFFILIIVFYCSRIFLRFYFLFRIFLCCCSLSSKRSSFVPLFISSFFKLFYKDLVFLECSYFFSNTLFRFLISSSNIYLFVLVDVF